MNKQEFINLISSENSITKTEAEKIINMFTEGVTHALNNNNKKDGQLQLIGFGTFKVTHQKAREGRNPQTGAKIQIKASNRPAFTAGQTLKDSVN